MYALRPSTAAGDASKGTVDALRAELVADVGGDEVVTAAQRMLIDAAVVEWWKFQHVGRYLATLPDGALVNKQKHRVHRVVRDHSQIGGRLVQILSALGLERRAVPVQDIRQQLGLDD
jgi:hypothetical protein